jgi:16S rRNA (uracil1498-N3)-methyltransferase
MPQYLVLPGAVRGGRFTAGPEESAHMVRAARARPGDEVELFDGEGRRWLGVIEGADPGGVTGRVAAELTSPEYKFKLTLCQAVVARAALESAFERCTAAGAAALRPVLTSRVQFDLFSGWERKRPRLEQVALAACKQCGRGRLPALLPPARWDELFEGPCVVASAGGLSPDRAAAALSGAESAKLFIGPEGGLTKGELDYAASKGAVFMGLGLHVLRAEDAAFAAVSALLTRLS